MDLSQRRQSSGGAQQVAIKFIHFLEYYYAINLKRIKIIRYVSTALQIYIYVYMLKYIAFEKYSKFIHYKY